MIFRPSFISRVNGRLIGISAVIWAVAYAKLLSRERQESVDYWTAVFILSNLSQLAYLSLGWRLDLLMLLAALAMLVLTCIAFAVVFAWLGLRLFGSRIAFWKHVI